MLVPEFRHRFALLSDEDNLIDAEQKVGNSEEMQEVAHARVCSALYHQKERYYCLHSKVSTSPSVRSYCSQEATEVFTIFAKAMSMIIAISRCEF